MPAESRRVLLAAARSRRLPPLAPASLVLHPFPHALQNRNPTTLVAAARPDAWPIRDGSITEARIDAALPPDELRNAVAECSRVLAADGRLTVDAPLRLGSRGFCRRLLAGLFRLPPPPAPESVARLLFDHGFDRIEQEFHGSLGSFRARRLAGRR
ncbi:MAG: hypothetical protein JXB32_18280 [Deltaproteobacteria bacterium]|nr:hypothetical protein [Deltaproteobacteria bacterium]